MKEVFDELMALSNEELLKTVENTEETIIGRSFVQSGALDLILETKTMDKIRFINNPFEKIIEIFHSRFPDKECNIYFDQRIKQAYNALGFTAFDLDPDVKPVIYLDTEANLHQICDTLSHELAHLALGPDCEDFHGEEWQEIYDWLHAEYLAQVGEPPEWTN